MAGRKIEESKPSRQSPPNLTAAENVMLMQDKGHAVNARSGTKQRRLAYSDKQWQAIEGIFARAGVDADFMLRGFMRRRLEVVALFFLQPRSSRSPKQQADEMRKRLAAFKRALAMLNNDDNFAWEHYYGDEDVDWSSRRVLQRERASKELTELISWIQKRVNQLKSMGRGSKHNARKRHISFWRELTHLWHEFVHDAGSLPHKHLLRFLFACSQPVFPEATNDAKLTAFIERHLPHYVLQTSTISRASIAG
jgi:hypothetical protein